MSNEKLNERKATNVKFIEESFGTFCNVLRDVRFHLHWVYVNQQLAVSFLVDNLNFIKTKNKLKKYLNYFI